MRILAKSLASAAVVVAIALPCHAEEHSSANVTGTADQKGVSSHEFINEAAIGGMAEVRLAALAQQKSASPEVKTFAITLQRDHENANTQLRDIAQKEGIPLPTRLDTKHEKLEAKLASLSGSQFDDAYMKAMVEDHQHDVELFREASAKGLPGSVQVFAVQTLPVLEQHLKMAREVSERTTPPAS